MNLFSYPWIHTAGRIIGLFLAVSLTFSFIDTYKKQGITKEYEDAYAKAKAENEQLKRTLSEAQTPEYVEREARNKLGLGREGESIVLMDMSRVLGEKSSVQSSVQSPQEPDLPNWKQWWRLFF